MKQEEIPEAWLQRWFEEAAVDNRLTAALTNRKELERRAAQLSEANLRTQDVARVGLTHARDICRLLDEAGLFSSNRSVSLDGPVQMRPDLILVTESAHYLLVELKTRAAAERQGVQELLAYSTAMKLRYPYVNEFIYIVVAGSWEPLLARSVQALIMDGKRVLPLQWTLHDLQGPLQQQNADADPPAAQLRHFTLDIRLDLFDLSFVQAYDPMLALSTSTLGVTRHTRLAPAVGTYFGRIASRAAADCHRIHQSGFAVVWAYPDYGTRDEIIHVSLATVNQHWVESGHVPGDYSFPVPARLTGIASLAKRQANEKRKAMTKDAHPDDFFAQSATYGAAAQYFPQSSLSYELLHRHRDYSAEQRLQKVWSRVGTFDSGPELNLRAFIRQMERAPQPVTIRGLYVFGEFADYVGANNCSMRPDFFELHSLLEAFQVHKGFGPPEPDAELRRRAS